MKYCSKCNIHKEINLFSVNNSRKDKRTIYCKDCNNKSKQEWKLANKVKVAEYDKQWQQQNKDKKAKNYKNWQVNNRAKVNSYNSYRRALELQATPSWLTESQKLHIECRYSLATMFSNNTGEPYHVDHIIPLNGKTVCGLHVPWNLQVIPAKENLRKSNRI